MPPNIYLRRKGFPSLASKPVSSASRGVGGAGCGSRPRRRRFGINSPHADQAIAAPQLGIAARPHLLGDGECRLVIPRIKFPSGFKTPRQFAY